MKKFFFFVTILCFHLSVRAQHNVVLIIADDLGTDYCGFYEDHADTVALPNLRLLLDKGIRFQNAMSNPVCSSTRSGILTGRYSFRTGVGNIVGGTGGSGALDTSEISIPKLLKIYNPLIGRANIGKWHLELPMPASNLMAPLALGYEHYEGPFIGQLPNYYMWTKYTNGIASMDSNYATSENVDNAVTWLKTQSSKPVFLWLAFNAPHTPYHLPPAGLYSDLSLSGSAMDINNNPKKYFKASLEALDHEIGRFFDSLKVMNRFDSTDFIFIGDNGNATRVAQIADTNRAKGTIYQYGVHVPFIVSGPSVKGPNRVSSALVNTADIFATVLELFGDTTWSTYIPSSKSVDSKSLLPIIENSSSSVRPWSFTEIFKLTSDSSDGKAMRNDDYKLIRFDYGKEEFYNLQVDPSETNDLLLTALSATDIDNYNYLCSEMTMLVGSGTFCKDNVGIGQPVKESHDWQVYPNPFSSHLFVSTSYTDQSFELSNIYGQLVYQGTAIEAEDFSNLIRGVYFLKRKGQEQQVFILTKQ